MNISRQSQTRYARYRFHEKMQGTGETFEQFVTEIKLLVKDCGYPNRDEIVWDCIVHSHKLAQTQLKEMIRGKDLNNNAIHAIGRRREPRRTHTDYEHTGVSKPSRLMRLFSDTAMKPATQRLTSYGGEFLKVKGTFRLKCKHKNTSIALDFYVFDTKAPPILGMKASVDLNLIKLILAVGEKRQEPACTHTDSLLQEYTDVFQGIGEFPGECNLHIDPHVAPVVYTPHRVPLALRERLKQELDKMEECNVISKVTEPTEWVNALVVVKKPQTGKLRVCLDPRALKKAIQRPHYLLPTLEDVTTKLAGAR